MGTFKEDFGYEEQELLEVMPRMIEQFDSLTSNQDKIMAIIDQTFSNIDKQNNDNLQSNAVEKYYVRWRRGFIYNRILSNIESIYYKDRNDNNYSRFKIDWKNAINQEVIPRFEWNESDRYMLEMQQLFLSNDDFQLFHMFKKEITQTFNNNNQLSNFDLFNQYLENDVNGNYNDCIKGLIKKQTGMLLPEEGRQLGQQLYQDGMYGFNPFESTLACSLAYLVHLISPDKYPELISKIKSGEINLGYDNYNINDTRFIGDLTKIMNSLGVHAHPKTIIKAFDFKSYALEVPNLSRLLAQMIGIVDDIKKNSSIKTNQ